MRLKRLIAAAAAGFVLSMAPGLLSTGQASAVLYVGCWTMSGTPYYGLSPGSGVNGMVCQDADGDFWWID